MTQSEEAARVRVVFDLPQDENGWPPAASERMWAVPVAPGRVMLDNIPFFVRGVALGDVVRIETDDEGVVRAAEAVEFSGNCTIRVVPFTREPAGRQAVLDAFASWGVEGEGAEQFGLVALNVPPTADLAAVRRLLVQGEADGLWDYEEGCVTDAWRALDPA
ncbi:DUF4265 domain-containing protein [Microbispora sp. NPDC046933]|uniref:DUF4265 domain-containing protein n=1 Tax=Microbispora sp. NPDC046933 TaxID=3155618 RepID=UPI0033FF8A5D